MMLDEPVTGNNMSPASPPYVITVVLNTNRRDDTLACLASLQANTYLHHTVLVLDNHSTDGSVQAISDSFPAAKVIPLDENLGYAGNNNVGIKIALAQGADWVFVLNEDTVLAENCISLLVEAGSTDHKIGVVGPMVYHFDEPAVIQSAGGKLGRYWQTWHLSQNEPDDEQLQQPRQVDWISGCGIMVRKEVIDQIGALDARFFYYWEEVEWCLRAKEAGWDILQVPGAKLWHKGVQRDYQPGPNITYYSTRNRLLMLSKHNAPLSVKAFTWAQTLKTLVSWSIRPKWRPKKAHRDAMWQGISDYLNKRWGVRSTN